MGDFASFVLGATSGGIVTAIVVGHIAYGLGRTDGAILRRQWQARPAPMWRTKTETPNKSVSEGEK
jgi:hypothetical protein